MFKAQQFIFPIIYKAGSLCPSLHLPFEKYLMTNINYPSCFIRTNPPSIVLGANQIAKIECNLNKIKMNNIKLIRRFSGGGAVYLDEGNCMFGLFGPSDKITADIFTYILTSAINKTFNVKSISNGKNDIFVDGYKVADLTYNKNNDNFLCHACISVNTEISALTNYLTPHQKKIMSVDKKVVNLTKYNKLATRGDLENELMVQFCKEFNCILNVNNINVDKILTIKEVADNYDKMNNYDYLYGKHFKYNLAVSEKFSWGFIQIFMTITNFMIINAEINTDCLDVEFPTTILNNILLQTVNDLDDKLNENQSDKLNDIYRMIIKELRY